MATNRIDIIVKVTDAASSKLNQVEGALKRVGAASKGSGIDLVQFNRTIFATTAAIGVLSKGFSSLASSFEKGADFDRLSTRFEATLGPTGQFIKSIQGFTDTSVDSFAAMRASLDLANLGIVTDSRQAAELMAKFGVVAKRAGLDTAVGVEELTNFLKEGNVAQLEHVGLLNKGNISLALQQRILQAAGGSIGGVIALQQRYAIAQDIINERTRGMMFGNRDLADSWKDTTNALEFLRLGISRSLLTAFAPLLDKVVILVNKFNDFFNNIQKNHKPVLSLVKNFIVLVGTIGTLVLSLSILKNSLGLLTSLGFGLPRIIGLVTGLGAAFLGTSAGATGLVAKLEVFGAFVEGVGQLIGSFLFDEDNFNKGIGRMDKSLADLLRKNHLLDFALTAAKAGAIITKFVTDVGKQLFSWARTLDNIVAGLVNRFEKLMGLFGAGPTSRGFLGEGGGVGSLIRNLLVKLTAGGLVAFGLSRLTGFGGGRGPSGRKGDPIYVRSEGGLGGGSSFLGGLFGGKALEKVFGKAAVPASEEFLATGGLMGAAGKAGTGLMGMTGTMGKLGKLGWIGVALTAISAISTILGDGTAQQKVASLVGQLGPTAAGAALGSFVFPGLGTAAGAGIGGLVGALGISDAIEKWINSITDNTEAIKSSRSDVTVPEMPESNIDSMAIIAAKISTLQGESREQARKAFSDAMMPGSEAGIKIGAAEWATLMKIIAAGTAQGIKDTKEGPPIYTGSRKGIDPLIPYTIGMGL